MRRAEATLLTIIYILLTGVIAPIVGAMVEKSNDGIITKTIGYEDGNVTIQKKYPKIYLGE